MDIVKDKVGRHFDEKPDLPSSPLVFQQLTQQGSIGVGDVQRTPDGFWVVTKSIAALLIEGGVPSLRSFQGQTLECQYFFDDWYLYALPDQQAHVYGLFKMREQEYDAENGLQADGDTPGVTISFIAFDPDFLINCLLDPTISNQQSLEQEVNRVVASRGQRHHPAIKDYFKRSESQGAYLVAKLYVRKIAFLAEEGSIPVPKHYGALCRNLHRRKKRLPAFIAANNEEAGYCVCADEKIYIQDPSHLSPCEEFAILATHTANVSFHSFAAEVCFHARFLTELARIPLPFLGRSVYDSAIRADMTIAEGELVGPTPYYRLGSRLLRKQRKFHPVP